MLRGLLLVLVGLSAAGTAGAHTRSQSFSSWTMEGLALVGVFQVDARRVTQLGEDAGFDALDALLASHLAQTVSVSQAGRPCVAHAPRPLVAARGDVRVELVYDCAKPLTESGATVVLGAFFDTSPSHVHYARVAREAGAGHEVLATAGSHTFEVGGSDAEAPTDFGAFFRLGLEHVLSGVDHLAFLAALALLAGGLGRAVWAATGFTLGHSLTLGLVALGWLSPDTRAIEALIGFTVAFAAGEASTIRAGGPSRLVWATLGCVAAVPVIARLAGLSVLPWAVLLGTAAFALCAGGLGGETSRRFAPALAAAFGLAHGAGFAGALLGLDIPRDRLLSALFGFNLGVEAAQVLALAAVAVVTLAASWLPGAVRRRSLDYATAGLFAVGVYWFLGRSLQ